MEEPATSSEDPHLPLRLGVSTSSFLWAMPPGLFRIAASGGKFDAEQNRQMANYTRNIMSVLKDSSVRSLECYHMLAWNADPITEVILDGLTRLPEVEPWSVHAPYGPQLDPSLPDPEIHKAAIAACKSAIRVAKAIGAKTIITHPGADVDIEIDRKERLQLSVHSLMEIADMAAAEGLRIAIEPLPKREPGNTIEELVWIVEHVDRPNAGVCLDTNHLFPASCLPNAIRTLGSRLFSMHVSDHDGGGERHWLPLKGVVDWSAITRALREINYTGPLIYEVHGSCKGSCMETMNAIEASYAGMMRLTSVVRGLVGDLKD